MSQPAITTSRVVTAAPLNAKQRQALAQYWFARHGLQFGLPHLAYNTAVKQMRAMAAPLARRAQAAEISSTPTWNFIGPEPMENTQANFGGVVFGPTFTATGRITAIAIDPTTNPNRIFVGAANGGIWMSTDGGTTFKSIGDSLPTQAIGAIALDTVNSTPPTIYVATGEGNNSGDSYYGQGIFKSSDLGNSWTPLAPGTFDHAAFTKLAIDASRNPPYLFAAASRFGVSAGRADPNAEESDLTKEGLWRSTDGGTTWTHYPASTFGCGLNPNPAAEPCPAEDVVIDPANPANIYVGIEFDNVFRSTDSGVTWSAVALPGIAAGLGHMDRESLAVDNGNVYAMIGAPDDVEYIGFFKSTDDGSSWTAETVPSETLGAAPNTVTIDGTANINDSQEYYDQTLLIDPGDSTGNTVFFGGVGLYESTNGGSTWSFLPANGGVHCDQHALAIGSDNNTVYSGNDGGAYTFSMSGISGGAASFTSLNNTLAVGQIQGIDPHPTINTTLLAGFQDNGTQLDSGSLAWNAVETGDGGFTLYDRNNPIFAYHTFAAGGTSVPMGISADGGSTWTDFSHNFGGADPGFAFYPPLASDAATAERVLLGGHFVWVLNFTSGTITQQSTQDLTGGCATGACALQDIEFVPSDNSEAWALSMQSGTTPFKVFNTTQANLDTGATWNDVTANLTAAFPSGKTTDNTQATGIAPDPNNPNNAYLSISGFTAVTGIGHIFKTTDFGATWSEADGAGGSSPLPDVPVLRVLVDETDSTGNTIYAATDVGVFLSTDGGTTWSAFNLGAISNVPVFDIEQNKNGVVFAGTHGRGAYQLAISEPSPTPSRTPTPTPTPSVTSTPTSTPIITPTPSPTPTITPTPTPVATPGKLGLSSGRLSFRRVGIDTIRTKTLRVTNRNARGVLIGNVSAGSPPFMVLTGAGAFTLNGRQSTTITVQFAPTATGSFSNLLTLTSNDPRHASVSVTLTGMGVPGKLAAPLHVSFPKVPSGTTLSKTFNVKNKGLGELHGSIGAITGPFSITSGAGSFVLSHGQTTPVIVEFEPSASGKVSGSLNVTSDDPSRPSLTVMLTGTGE